MRCPDTDTDLDTVKRGGVVDHSPRVHGLYVVLPTRAAAVGARQEEAAVEPPLQVAWECECVCVRVSE